MASVAEAIYRETCLRFDYNERQRAFETLGKTIALNNKKRREGEKPFYSYSIDELVGAQREAKSTMDPNSKRFFETLNYSVSDVILGYIAAEHGLNPTDKEVLDAVKIFHLNDADKQDNNEGVLYNHFKKMFDGVCTELNVPENMRKSIESQAIKSLMDKKEGIEIKPNDYAIYSQLGEKIYMGLKETLPQKYGEISRLNLYSADLSTERYWTQLEKSVMSEFVKPFVSWEK